MTWRTSLARITVFPHGDPRDRYVKWADVIGGAPSRETSQRGARSEEAPMAAGVMRLAQTQPPRVDLVYFAPPPPDFSDEPPSVGSLAEALGVIMNYAPALLRSSPIVRVALAVQLMRPAESTGAAQRFLQEHIRRTKFDLDGVRDFEYQVNRQRGSRVIDGLIVNRLAKWHEGLYAMLALEAATGRRSVGPAHAAAALDIDVNTDGARVEALPADSALAILDELRMLVDEIAEGGDQP